MTQQEQLKQEIFVKIERYYELVHKQSSQENFLSEKIKINYAGRVYDKNELINLVDSSLDFWLTYGKYSKIFEKKLANFLNIKYTFLVNSGSSANLLAFYTLTSHLLKERQIKRGDEVITVAAGFPTTVAPIVQYGAVPVFVDIELKSCNIDVTQLENALSSKTKAVMIAHTLGNPFNIEEVVLFCKKYNLWLIEDNCDALGSKYNNKLTGTFGDIGTSSFYPPHHITMGEGGAVYTNNPMLKKIMLSMRDWGRDCWCESGVDNTCGKRFEQQFGTLPVGYDHKYVYSHFGFNLKATDMQAAIGVAQLDKLSSFTARRRENHSMLLNRLEHFSDYFELPGKQEVSEPSWFGFLLIVKENKGFTRNEIVKYLEYKGIQTRNLFAGNIVRQPLFINSMKLNKDYRVIGKLSNTDRVMNDAFWIGVYPNISQENIDYICHMIDEFINKH